MMARDERVTGLTYLIDEELARFKVPGAAVAVINGDEIALSRGFGQRDGDLRLPVTEHTLFPIGSTTKAFTSAVVGTLVDEGSLAWDRPIREYLPGFELSDPIAARELTVRDMLSHRSGLPRHDMLMLMYGGGGLSRADLVERLRYLEFNKGFRAEWQYNNLLYMAVGHLIEVVTGVTWEDAVQQRVLDPLDMTETNFSLVELQKSDDHSLGYSEQNGSVVPVPFRSIEIIGPAGSINSSISDMCKWLRANIGRGDSEGGSIVSQEALKEIRAPAIVLPGDAIPWDEVNLVGYALGWLVEDFRGHRLVWHNGGVDGFKTIISFIPSADVGVVVLSNRFPSFAPETIAYAVLEQLLDLEALPWGERYLQIQQTTAEGSKDTRARRRARSKTAPPTHSPSDYAGSYVHPGYGRISFAVDGDQLVADLHDLRVTMEHRHYDVWEANEEALDLTIQFSFAMDFEGEIASVHAALEPTVDPIVFSKEPDRALSDPEFLDREEGVR